MLSTALAWSYRADEVLAAAADPHSDALLVAVALPPLAPEGEPAGTVNMAPPRYVVLEFAARAPSMRGPSTAGEVAKPFVEPEPEPEPRPPTPTPTPTRTRTRTLTPNPNPSP